MQSLSGKIGLLADSHGNLPATVAAIQCLQENGADQLYHLGDLFDSVRDNDFMTILNTLCNNCVIGIKGNTDYFLTCCGHSHQPVLFRWRSGEVHRETLSEKYLISFSAAERYILIVGAVDNGECGLLDLDGWMYQRLRIDENCNG